MKRMENNNSDRKVQIDAENIETESNNNKWKKSDFDNNNKNNNQTLSVYWRFYNFLHKITELKTWTMLIEGVKKEYTLLSQNSEV